MKIVVIGTGKVGTILVEQLAQEGHQIVAIDHNEKKLLEIQNSLDVLCIAGHAVKREILIEAGIESADLAIAATDSDEVNMLCALLARKLGAAHTIARVRKPELAEEIKMFSEDMGLSMTINPELYAAQEIFSLLRYPGLMSVESFRHGLFEIAEFQLAEEGPATSMTLHELAVRYRSKALVCAIRRNGATIIPDGRATLMKGDVISFAAEPKETEHFLELCGIKSRIPKHIIIIGAGMITFYLVRMMHQMGMKPIVIEKDFARADVFSQFLPYALVLNADGTNRAILDEEGIDSADAFITLTGTDEVNLLLGLYAYKQNVPKVVSKVSKSSMIDFVDTSLHGSLVCPRDIVANRVISYVRAAESAGSSNVETVYRIAQNSAEALEFIVREKYDGLTGIPLRDIDFKEGILICGILRDGKVIIPRGNDTIEQGDHVIIATTLNHLTDLSMVLK